MGAHLPERDQEALLQSCPWLPIVLVPLFLGRRDDANRRALLLLFLVPAVVIPIYAFFAWHGELALNLRYFLPTLPFLSLLAADAIRRTRASPPRRGWERQVAAATTAALYLLLRLPTP